MWPDQLQKLRTIKEQCKIFASNIIQRKDKEKSRLLGLILMFVSGIFLMLGNTLFQYIHVRSRTHISSSAVLIIRCIIQLLCSAAHMMYKKIHMYGKWKKNLLPLVGMGIFEVGVIVFMYEAFQRMPVGDATVLQFTAPVFTAFLSFMFLESKLSWFDVLFGITSFIGVIFIAKPDLVFPDKFCVSKVLQSTNYNLSNVNNNTELAKTMVLNNYLQGAAFVIAAAFCLSCFFILNNVVGKIDVVLTIFYPSVAGIVIGPVVMLIRKENISFITEIEGVYWGLLFVIGLTAFIGLMLLGESLQHVDPLPGMLVRNCDVIFVFIFQYLLMHMTPTVCSGIGTAIILSCTTLIAFNQSLDLDKKCCGRGSSDGQPEESGGEEIRQLLNNDEED